MNSNLHTELWLSLLTSQKITEKKLKLELTKVSASKKEKREEEEEEDKVTTRRDSKSNAYVLMCSLLPAQGNSRF